jgi:hypothetical protein
MITAPLVTAAAGGLLHVAELAVVAFFVVLHTGTAAMLLAAIPELWRHWDVTDEPELAPVLASAALPTVSVVVSGRAEQGWTIQTVQSLLTLEYPRHEVVLVHDGAEHGFLPALVEVFDLYAVPPAVLVNVPTGPVRGYYRSRTAGKLFVLDKAFEGAADDLNAALNASRFPYVLMMHPRTRLVPTALHRLMRPFLAGGRPAGVAGTVRISAASDVAPGQRAAPSWSWLSGVRTVERLRESVYSPIGWNRVGGKLPSQEGVLVLRRDHLLEIDGFRATAADPVRDAVERIRSQRRAELGGDAVSTVPDLVAWERATTPGRAVGRRRAAVHAGRLDELFARRRGAGVLHGEPIRLLVPLHLIAAVAAPVVELLGYVLLAIALAGHGWRDAFVAQFVLVVPGYAALLSFWAIALERMWVPHRMRHRDTGQLLLFAIAEQLGYRQWAMANRLHATWQALARTRRLKSLQSRQPPAEAELPGADRVPLR